MTNNTNDSFFSLDFHMNNEPEIDNEAYVFVEFDNDMDIDEDSYDQCNDEELSLTPSTSASVCSETMFGDMGSTVAHGSSNNVGMIKSSSSLSNSTNAIVGKPRSCSIVSLYEEDEGNVFATSTEKLTETVGNYQSRDDSLHHEHATPMEEAADDENGDVNMSTGKFENKSNTISEDKNNNKTSSTTTSKTSSTKKANKSMDSNIGQTKPSQESSTIGSRLSNKKRRKKMKQLKKAAALAAFTGMKEQSMQTTYLAVTPMQTVQGCVDDLKEELNMKKQVNGTLNFSIC